MIIYEKSQPFNKHVNTKTREEYLCLQNVNRKLILMQCKRTILSCYAVGSQFSLEQQPIQKFYKHAMCLAIRFAEAWHSIKSNYYNFT